MDRHGSPALGPKNDASTRIQKESAADKLAALKARVSAAIGSTNKGPGLGLGGMNTAKSSGLNVPLHPVLADVGKLPNKAKDSRATKQDNPKVPTNKKPDLSNNPYFDPTHVGKARSRPLHFNEKGKYIAQGQAIRKSQKLEELKKRIAAQTRKVGIDEDVDVERKFLVEEQPELEWWDEAYIDGKDMANIEDPKSLKIDTPDTIITSYIQHPVPIAPPDEKNAPAPKPMYLTTHEQKKLRRQRRMADLKEEQSKQRLGLLPTPEPKVTLKNLVRVMGSEAVLDPTKVEEQVRGQVAARHDKHLHANEERKLTKEQKAEKLQKNQEMDAQKGLHILVFKIDSLANGQHRYKINVNAEQHALTGTVIMHPKFSLVVAEGGVHSIKKYRKLLVDRIDWQEAAPSRVKEGGNEIRDWLKAEDEKGELKDMGSNKCQLIFEGEVKQRGFRKWGSKVCETDAEARDVLSRAKMENFWNLAKSTQ